MKTGPGGIRDVEFTIQFLQLLNGGDLPEVRQRDTLVAIQALEAAGCLTDPEYRGSTTPTASCARSSTACSSSSTCRPTGCRTARTSCASWRCGWAIPMRNRSAECGIKTCPGFRIPHSAFRTCPRSGIRLWTSRPRHRRSTPAICSSTRSTASCTTYHDKTRLNRTILDHLLHQTFADSAGGSEPETDLILDPDPDEATVQSVLGRYGFRDVPAAWQNLTRLAQEQRFLSTRRCRHFLASIAPQLLRAVAATPDPTWR